MTNNNDFAFPAFDQYNNIVESGLSKREYLAAIAMQGLLARTRQYLDRSDSAEWYANLAVIQADALIEQLNK